MIHIFQYGYVCILLLITITCLVRCGPFLVEDHCTSTGEYDPSIGGHGPASVQ